MDLSLIMFCWKEIVMIIHLEIMSESESITFLLLDWGFMWMNAISPARRKGKWPMLLLYLISSGIFDGIPKQISSHLSHFVASNTDVPKSE